MKNKKNKTEFIKYLIKEYPPSNAYLKDLKRVGQDRNHLLGNILVDQSEFNFIGFKMELI